MLYERSMCCDGSRTERLRAIEFFISSVGRFERKGRISGHTDRFLQFLYHLRLYGVKLFCSGDLLLSDLLLSCTLIACFHFGWCLKVILLCLHFIALYGFSFMFNLFVLNFELIAILNPTQ